VLSGLGFDLKLLGSQKHVSDKLQSLTSKQLESLKATFIKNDHPRFRRNLKNRNSLSVPILRKKKKKGNCGVISPLRWGFKQTPSFANKQSFMKMLFCRKRG
jgi:hypothetical protein